MKFSSTLDSESLSLTVDNQVKERLTGAIILVGVLVLLVPELLTGPKSVEPAAQASSDELPMRSYTIDLNDDARGGRALAPAAPSVRTPARPEPGLAALEDTSGTATEMADVDPGSGSAEEWVGADAKGGATASAPASAGAAPAQAAETPVPAPPSPARSAPERSKPGTTAASGADEARRASQTPDGGAGAKAVAPVPPPSVARATEPGTSGGDASASRATEPTARNATPTASASEPAKPVPKPSAAGSEGWSVQVGSFASSANANRLVKELKGKGFSAFIVEGRSNGRKLYRVRVGPEPDRSAAQKLAGRLRAAGRSGAIVPP